MSVSLIVNDRDKIIPHVQDHLDFKSAPAKGRNRKISNLIYSSNFHIKRHKNVR